MFASPRSSRDAPALTIDALQVRDAWIAELDKAGKDVVKIDILSWLGKATLDVIGLAGRISLLLHTETAV